MEHCLYHVYAIVTTTGARTCMTAYPCLYSECQRLVRLAEIEIGEVSGLAFVIEEAEGWRAFDR
jgi:hypothetical protein